MKILQLSTSDISGGAERVAWEMHQAYRARGVSAWLAVGQKYSQDPAVFQIQNRSFAQRWEQWWQRMGDRLYPFAGKIKGAGTLCNRCYAMGQFPQKWQQQSGHENFDFPGSRHVLRLPPESPELLHAHNLHGYYFDLRWLPHLSRRIPTILTLHDAWLLSGHCAHSLGCERWKTGCGQCPNLTIYPEIHHDATAFNWRRKQRIYQRSRLYLATPAQWLMANVEQSVLRPAILEQRVIPYGIDLHTFKPGDQSAARRQFGLPEHATILLFIANRLSRNMFKDYHTIRTTIELLAQYRWSSPLCCIAIGDSGESEAITESIRIQYVPFQKDPALVRRYYQAADLYLHAAHADTFPRSTLEALACGTPVVATAVGGIPEQIEHQHTGLLVPHGAAAAMAAAITELIAQPARLSAMRQEAAASAARRFNLARMVETYLAWYQEILSR